MLTFLSLTPFCRHPMWHSCTDLPHHPSSSNAHTYICLSVSRASWLLVFLYLDLLRLSPLFALSTQAATDDRQLVRSRSAAALSRGALRQRLQQLRGYHCGTCLSSCPERPSVYTGFGMRCSLISPPRTAIGQACRYGDAEETRALAATHMLSCTSHILLLSLAARCLGWADRTCNLETTPGYGESFADQ